MGGSLPATEGTTQEGVRESFSQLHNQFRSFDDIRDERIVSPALLVIERDLGNPPDVPPKKSEVSLSERFRYQQRLQSHIWSRCSPKVDQGIDTIETKRCRTQRKMETWENCGHLSWKTWMNSHNKGPGQERKEKQNGADMHFL